MNTEKFTSYSWTTLDADTSVKHNSKHMQPVTLMEVHSYFSIAYQIS